MNPIRRWLARKRLDSDLSEEMAAHMDEKLDDLLEQGWAEPDARSAIRQQFGNPTLLRENSRAAWGWNGLEQFGKDLGFGCRQLGRNPGFTLTALLTLSLGIGASTTVFTLLDSVILRPLNYRHSGELVAIWERVRFLSSDPLGPNPRHVDVWRGGSTMFSGLTLLQQGAQGVAATGEHPQLVGTVTAEPNLFEVLQVHPILGRNFRSEDATDGHDHVAILSFSLWQSLFNGSHDAIGKTIRISNTPTEVIGVLPKGFRFPNRNSLRPFRSKQALSSVQEAELFLPAVIHLDDLSWNSDYGNWIALARLKPGVTATQATAQLAPLEDRVVAEMPPGERDSRAGALRVSLQSMQDAVVGDARKGLWLLMIAVLGLLLIACLNLANAQLGRAVLREREAALRSALGASRWRLFTGALAENLTLAAAGGAGGILLALAATESFKQHSPVDLPRLSEIHLNLPVLAFSLVLTVGSSLLFGIIPALRLMHTDPQRALKQNNARSLGSARTHQVRVWLIGLQVLGSTVLLLVTGLFLKNLLNLLYQEQGFETRHVAVAEVDLFSKAFEEKDKRIGFDDAILRSLRALPGVESAGLISTMPLEGESWIESLRRVDRTREKAPLVNLRWVSPGFFETVHQKLIAGRLFEERDRKLNSIILSEGEAHALWPEGDPIGAAVQVEGRRFTVIGIVADAHTTSLKTHPANMAYAHYKDRPPFTTFFLVRGKAAADLLLSEIRHAIWRQIPDVTIARVKTLDSQLADSLAGERFQTSTLAAFAIAALLLAMLGIYGVLNYSVASRRQEIGVRMALGAARTHIYGLTLKEAVPAVAGGMVAGFATSLLAKPVIQSSLYEVQSMDLPVAVSVAVLFVMAAMTAAFLPARGAASLDPMAALRSE